MARLLAWLGGLAFVGSLAYLAYFFAVPLGSPATDQVVSAPLAALINVALFSAFALHHSLLARTSAKQWLGRIVPASAERSLYVWIASALLMTMCLLWRPLPGMVYEAESALRILSYGLQALGVFITIRGAAVIDPLELAGIRQATAGASRDELKVVGPFRVVRHPIYLGWMLMVFAAPTMTVNRLLFAVISSAYLILAIPWEERSLVAAHGDRYRDYQRQVRWRVVPGIW